MNERRVSFLLLLVGLITAVILLAPSMSQQGSASALDCQISFYEPYLVKNINPRTHGSYPRCAAVGDSYALCAADDGLSGNRLWRSDGTESGTYLLKELFDDSGAQIYLDQGASTGSGLFYFIAQEGCCTYDYQLWKTNGTTAGTEMVTILPGEMPYSLVTIDEMLYFIIGGDGLDTFEKLWKSDGTAAGTGPFFEPPRGNFGNSLTAYDGRLYFRHFSEDEGSELWTSDGSTANTELLVDIYPGVESSEPHYLTAAGDFLYFVANDGVHGRELWKTDGSEAGTILVQDFNPGIDDSSISDPTAVADLLFFTAFHEGTALWRTDGSEGGSSKLLDQIDLEGTPTAADNLLYFQYYDYADHHKYLGRSDGTPSGTFPLLLMDDDPMNDSSVFCLYGFEPQPAGSSLYFPWTAPETGCELWRSDGTAAGTQMVQDILAGSDSSHATPLAYINELMLLRLVLFPTDDTSQEGLDDELGVTDGTAVGAKLLLNINQTPNSSEPSFFTKYNNLLFFSADDGTAGYELWSSDGTATGTNIITDLRPGKFGSSPRKMAATKNGLVFFASADGSGLEMYTSDGTSAGTTLIEVIGEPSREAYVREIIEWNGYAFFTVTIYSDDTYEFWRTDGSIEGTLRLGQYYVEKMIPAANQLYFIQRGVDPEVSPTHAPAYLGFSDGTAAGTHIHQGLPVHSCSLDYESWAVIGDQLYFAWCDSESDQELWQAANPYSQLARVKDINLQGSSNPESLAVFANEVYFTADDGLHGPALWKTDGTNSGTKLVIEKPAYDITPYSGGFFFIEDGLWVSDGTAEGTERLADINVSVSDMIVAGDHLFYIDKILKGSDGSVAGTGVIDAPNAAEFNSLLLVGNKFFFDVENQLGDRELWALNLNNLPNDFQIFMPSIVRE
jgi:ELWxxDGT repeat protein